MRTLIFKYANCPNHVRQQREPPGNFIDQFAFSNTVDVGSRFWTPSSCFMAAFKSLCGGSAPVLFNMCHRVLYDVDPSYP
jgi:hypothetical protein